jgi:hypothetical protein
VKRGFTLAAIITLLSVLTGPASGTGIVAAKQENDPEIIATLQTINRYRSWLGIPPLTIDPHLQQAAEAHVEYYRLNFGDPTLAGMGLHYETSGRPGFTGESFQDRADAAGYDGHVNENAGLSGSMLWSLDWFIATVGHRLTLLDPRYVHIGLAAIDEGEKRFEIIDLGAPSWSQESDPDWVAWPPHGATGVGLSFHGEAPNPFPDADYPVSYPITLKWFGPGDLTLTSVSIGTGGALLPSFAEIGTGWLSRKTVLLCATTPFEAGTTYSVRAEGTANGAPFVADWSFTTTHGDDPLALDRDNPIAPVEPVPDGLPAGLVDAHPAVQQLWLDADEPVARQEVERSWLWGPDAWSELHEPYVEAAGGSRPVYYFDKARMEVNQREAGSDLITAGLLVRDMIAGMVQVGDAQFTQASPAVVPLTGDPLNVNPDAPTYASLHALATTEPGRAVVPRRSGPVVEVVAKSGVVSVNSSLGGFTSYGSYEATTGHNIAAIFDHYVATLATDWHMSVGLPLTEPYWVQTNLAGVPTWVLVQAFERRILTFTPINDPDWQVEMGNVGRHYYTWRYGDEPPATR